MDEYNWVYRRLGRGMDELLCVGSDGLELDCGLFGGRLPK